MFGLPNSTEINKQIPKNLIFEKFKPSVANRKLFNEQISRLSIVAEVSPQTVSIATSKNVSAIYIILIKMKTTDCDRKNIMLLSKLIEQRMIFALHYENNIKFAVYRANTVLVSESKPMRNWKLNLDGFDIGSVWDNIIAETLGIKVTEGKTLGETIINNEHIEKLTKKIVTLEKKAMNEKQPRRKWELVEEIERLKVELKRIK